uniref:VWFA domain-containing protein n=1 Tax=Esox lucius TaxID=8010 RepID=A0A6Q2XMT1_ESOLU
MHGDLNLIFSRVWSVCLLLVWICLGTRIIGVVGSHQGSIPLHVVKLWASAFGGEIKSISAKYSGSQLLQKKYKEFEQAVRVQEIDGLRLVKKLAENMEEMFHKKSEAMKRLVEAAEEAHLQHEEDPDLQYEYFNAVLINEIDEEGNSVELGGDFLLQPNDHFNNLSVNLSLSVVQVPTNMYNKDSAIVNGVYWSEALNKVFVDNFERDPSLIWQYFGSAKGFFRQYPGIKWRPDEHGVIAFDCRNRKWYIQAATSPKDVVILVDVSGSMKGLRLTIARQTVSSILDTLGDDDFFNVIAVSHACVFHFRMNLDKLFAKGIGMLDVGLTEAFEVLYDFNQTGRGSACSQAIMLVTDGAVDTYDAVFAKYNWPDRKVRIFPYLIGRESAFADNLKWMACANKGYFTQISTLADVQENVMEYLHVLSRPKVIDQEHDTVWTEAYVDSTLEDGQGPILMTTVAMPVFSTKNETRNRGILLGVVGTDVPVSELLKTIPKYKYEENKKRRKPNYSSVDLSEVEWEDKDDIVSHFYYHYISGNGIELNVLKLLNFLIFMSLEYLSVLGLHDLEHPDVQLADEWTYCNTDEHPEHRYLSQIDAIKLYLSGREPHLKCDKELIQEVLFDAVVTAPLEAYWTNLVLNKSENSDKGVEIAYLGTRTGLSRINLFVVPDQDFLTAEDKEGVFNADHFPLWYKRAAEQVPGTFVYSLPFNTGNDNKSVVLASTAIQLLDERESPIAAAVGIQMKLEFFQRKFWTASRQVNTHTLGCNHSSTRNGIHMMKGFRVSLEKYVFISTKQSLVFSLLSTPKPLPPLSIAQRGGRTMLVPCDTEYPAFISERTIKETTGNIDCEGCIKSFVIQQIPSSNLFMVVVDNKCDCSAAGPITMEPIEIMYILFTESLKCERLKFQKDRRRPDSCHPFHPEENSMECGGALGLYPSLTTTLLCLMLALFPR